MKQVKNIITRIPGLKIITLCTLSAIIFWAIFIGHYYKKSKQLELERYQEYVRQHSDQEKEVLENIAGVQDSIRFEKETHRKMAEFYIERKQYKSAIQHFERVIDPSNVIFLEENKDFCLTLADAYINARMSTEAVRYLSKLKEVYRTDGGVLRRLGEACFYSGDWTNAALYLRDAMKADPKDIKSMVLLARIYSLEDHKRKDIPELLQKAISINPKSLDGYYYYGVYLSDRGDYALAEVNFKEALKIEPFHTPTMARLGMVYYYMGNINKAKEMYELVISINKTDYNTMYNLGELYLTLLNDPINAYLWFRNSVEINPDHFEGVKKLGVIALNNRNYKESCLWFEKAEAIRYKEKEYREEKITTDAILVDILIMHATALEALGKTSDAKGFLEKALEEDPLNQIARHKLQLLQLNG